MNLDVAVSFVDITPENSREKMLKAVRALSERLGVPVSVEDRKKRMHGPEPFMFRAQEGLVYKWYNFFSASVDDTYDFVVSYFGLPEARIVSKAGDFLRHKGKIIYSPETGEPIKQKDWDDFVRLLEKFLNRKLKDSDKKIILDGKTLGRILNRMLKYNRYEEIANLPLADVKYRGKTFDWISDSVKNMRTALGEELTRWEMARIQVMQQSAAQKITKTSDAMKNDIKQILIDAVKSRKGKSQASQELFDKMTGHTRDFQKIADTEIQNAMNNSILLDEARNAGPGEKVYFQRVEVIDGNTCPFCRKMNGVVALWSDRPLADDRIKDPVAKFAIWDGKDWDGKKDFVANGVFHPYCRGFWSRYGKGVDALVAHMRNQSELYDKALGRARAEWKAKGIENPNDKTPGFLDRVRELCGDVEKAFNPNQPRGANGRWIGGTADTPSIPRVEITSNKWGHLDDVQLKNILDALREEGDGDYWAAKFDVPFVGVRMDDVLYSVGDSLPPSRKWIDEGLTDELLDGTSAMSLDFAGRPANYATNYAYLIGGNREGWGEDAGEAIIGDAKVLAVVHGRNMGKSLTWKKREVTKTITEKVHRIFEGIAGMEKSLTWSGYELQDRYRFAGFNISVENRAGSVRSGKDKDGHEWHCKMHYDYGYIRGTEGVDGDHVDVYIGPDEEAGNVYIVHQNDPVTGEYDEDKVMLGFGSLEDARKAYLKQYDRPGFLGGMDVMPIEEFREKVLSKQYHGKMVKSVSRRVMELLGV